MLGMKLWALCMLGNHSALPNQLLVLLLWLVIIIVCLHAMVHTSVYRQRPEGGCWMYFSTDLCLVAWRQGLSLDQTLMARLASN